jgi:hypothetical protein
MVRITPGKPHHMPTYTTYLINFHMCKYEGDNLSDARSAAVKSGFESVIMRDNEVILSWSPVGGWRGHVKIT